MLSRELSHRKGTRIWRGILRQEINETTGYLQKSWGGRRPSPRHGVRDSKHGEATAAVWVTFTQSHCVLSAGAVTCTYREEAEALWGVSPATGSEPQTFCSIASTLPPHQHTGLLIFPSPTLLFVCLDFSLFPSVPAHPVRSSLNLILSVIVFPKHFS